MKETEIPLGHRNHVIVLTVQLLERFNRLNRLFQKVQYRGADQHFLVKIS